MTQEETNRVLAIGCGAMCAATVAYLGWMVYRDRKITAHNMRMSERVTASIEQQVREVSIGHQVDVAILSSLQQGDDAAA